MHMLFWNYISFGMIEYSIHFAGNLIKIGVRSQVSWQNGWTDSQARGVVGLLLAQGFAQDGSIRFSGTVWSGNPVKPE